MPILFAFTWQAIVDFLVLTTAIYWLLKWTRQTRVLRILVGLGGLVILGHVVSWLRLPVTAWLLQVTVIGGVILLVMVYYPDIRHALTHLDFLDRWLLPRRREPASVNAAISEAAFALASQHLGALVVVAGRDSMRSYLTGGVSLQADPSAELLIALFQKTSPLHDGAAIVEDGRITYAGALLPLTFREDLPNEYGTRHRAALGLAERCDASVVAVSEERSEVSLTSTGRVRRAKDSNELSTWLAEGANRPSGFSRRHLRMILFGNFRIKIAALAVAISISLFGGFAGSSVRTFLAPVEFVGVPGGLEVCQVSANTVSVQVRAATWLFDTLSDHQLVARFDLTNMSEGLHSLEIEADTLSLPPGFSLDGTTPSVLRFRLTRKQLARGERPQ
ncbi:MAG: diadenylate cyclase [Acidobacteriota bacterium]